MSEPAVNLERLPEERPDVVAQLERQYRRCYACILAGATACEHLTERRRQAALDETRVGFILERWTAQHATEAANLQAFRGELDPAASPIEVRLLQAFWQRGLDPVQQYRIGPYTVDFAFPRARLVVEADGAAYHHDQERERRRDEEIRRRGWHIKHFTGTDITRDADACVREILTLARSTID